MSQQSDNIAEAINARAYERRVNEHKTVGNISLVKARKEIDELYNVTGVHMYKALVVMLDFCIDLLAVIGDKKDVNP